IIGPPRRHAVEIRAALRHIKSGFHSQGFKDGTKLEHGWLALELRQVEIDVSLGGISVFAHHLGGHSSLKYREPIRLVWQQDKELHVPTAVRNRHYLKSVTRRITKVALQIHGGHIDFGSTLDVKRFRLRGACGKLIGPG